MNKDEIRKIVLDKIFSEKIATRPGIAKATGIRSATIFEIIAQLKQEGIVCEPDRNGRKSGRKASELTLTKDYMWAIGIYFQIHQCIGVIVDMLGDVQYRYEIPAMHRETLEECRQEIRSVILHLKENAGDDWNKVKGIGFADPGLVDIEKGYSIRSANVPGWRDSDTKKWLLQEFGLEALVLPECMVKTSIEYHSRVVGKNRGLFLLELDYGIGGGYMKDGVFFAGDTYQAMEIGHLVVTPNGPLCRCGNRGCLETIAGESGILRRVQEMISNKVDTVLDMEHFSIEKFAKCARTDKATKIIAAEICESIGRAISVAVVLLNPSYIVISGGLTNLGCLLSDTIKQVLDINCLPEVVRNLKIEFSTLLPEDTVKGMAGLLIKKILNF